MSETGSDQQRSMLFNLSFKLVQPSHLFLYFIPHPFTNFAETWKRMFYNEIVK